MVKCYHRLFVRETERVSFEREWLPLSDEKSQDITAFVFIRWSVSFALSFRFAARYIRVFPGRKQDRWMDSLCSSRFPWKWSERGRKLRDMDFLHRYRETRWGKKRKREREREREREKRNTSKGERCTRACIKPPYSFDGIGKSSAQPPKRKRACAKREWYSRYSWKPSVTRGSLTFAHAYTRSFSECVLYCCIHRSYTARDGSEYLTSAKFEPSIWIDVSTAYSNLTTRECFRKWGWHFQDTAYAIYAIPCSIHYTLCSSMYWNTWILAGRDGIEYESRFKLFIPRVEIVRLGVACLWKSLNTQF